MKQLILISLAFGLCCLSSCFFMEDNTETPAEKWSMDKLKEATIPRQAALDSIMHYHPNDPEPFYVRSVGQFSEGDMIEGIANLTKAAQGNPKLYLNYLGLVKMLYFLDYEGAEKAFEKSLKLKIYEDIIIAGSTYMRLGIVKMKLGKYKEAVECFQNDIKHFGKENVVTYSFVYSGMAKFKLGKEADALADFDEALAQWEKCPEAYYQKGRVLLTQGHKSLACKQFKKALLYKNFLWSNPHRANIEQLYVSDIEKMFDKSCR